ncbi:MAG: hypothetical protein DHS20C21_09860 [Gemmatimonadota bacterium]|nr:MAG: hypothetical protein DHS20C21_09860 [Gemmatimonadota bacterium]
MATLSKDQTIRPDTIRIGQLGRRPGGTGSSLRPEAAPRAAVAERERWTERYGRDWVSALEGLRLWAREVGIPVRAGSGALASSPLGQWWGWGGLPECIQGPQSGEGPSRSTRVSTWVLRVPAGWADCLRTRIESDSRLDARGAAPVLVVEECALAHLPAEPAVSRWPSPESWWRAERLLGLSGEAPLAPRTPEELVGGLQSGALGRHPLEARRARLAAWDLWCAASAWESDRAAWWLVRAAAGFASPSEVAQWDACAERWGLRLLPAGVERSGLCARAEGSDIRRGLEDLSSRAREVAPALVQDRVRGGAYHTAWEFVRRSRRRGADWSVIAEFALAGSLDELRESPLESGWRWAATISRRWWSRRRGRTAWVQQH